MDFEEAKQIVDKFNSETSSKIYRVCPNFNTDEQGYKKFIVELQTTKNPDARNFSNDNNFDILESII